MDHHQRILMVTFPGQSHINPSLQFAKRLIKMGVKVTLLTAFSALIRMSKTTPNPQGLTMVGFFDGYDNGWTDKDDVEHFMSELKRYGSEAVRALIASSFDRGEPFSRVVYTTLLPWIGKVVHDLQIPSTFLWIQPATILDVYYYFHNGYADSIRSLGNDPSSSIELPGLPPLASRDLPSFLVAANVYNFAVPLFKEHLEVFNEETNPKVLVNTFDALEDGPLRAVKRLNLVGVGPLIPSAFLDGKDPSDTSFGGDLLQKSSDYIEWLNLKQKESVVYVSFGSYSMLSKQQMEEITRGLLESGRPFLWVVRPKQNGEQLSCKEELERQGMIVPWCSQVEVLSHPSLGCFVTHCGWNSSLESLVSGVLVVAFPLWTDQGTNVKLIEDVWKTGVRVVRNEEGIVESDEILRCIELMVGREELKKNAKKWKDLAREAAKEGGSSDLNLKAFLEEVTE
ncbi:crocetin glucosyltransferase, chloroplastic-like [Camellia sinensis]|uniref:Glycosyltransferase n=1 Tax=Camellia sinensis var. sinensis TaxID=542762 RepID=A0A4S4ERP4_CAMSN|nr:crocetin glucosyltransferase, chloroplastic-like [Camellia sinensis]THG19015.1 hypothetical protein TEA_008753 [Camellia sinensis var. sinensis]